MLFAIGYDSLRRRLADYAGSMAQDEPQSHRLEAMGKALDWVDLHIADGWEPDENMAEFLELMRGKVASLSDDGEDGAE